MKAPYSRPAYGWAMAFLALLAISAPILGGYPDSFPLSTYPMFAKHRGAPILFKMVAVDGEQEVAVEPHWLGTNEVLQAKVLLQQVAGKNSGQRKRFCTKVAARVANAAQAAGWSELRLVRIKVDPIQYIEQGATPLEQKVLTRCPVHPKTEDRGS